MLASFVTLLMGVDLPSILLGMVATRAFSNDYDGGALAAIIDAEATVRDAGIPQDPDALQWLKSMGFSDARLAYITGVPQADITAARHAGGVRPVFKRIGTRAPAFAPQTP